MQTKHQYLNKYSAMAIIASLSLSLLGCGKPSVGAGHHGMPPATVVVINAQKQTVPFVLELPATLLGGKEVEVRARVSGILESRNFVEGDKIAAGKSLFSIDSKPFSIELDRTKAELSAAKARLAQAQHSIKRLKPLRKKNSVSQQQYDDAISLQDIMNADLKAAKASFEKAKLNVEYSAVKAPITGVVGRAEVSDGSYISGPQQLLTHITSYDKMRLRFGLSQRKQLSMRQEAQAGALTLPKNGAWKTRIKLQDGSFYNEVGQVNFSDVRINPNTGTSEFQAIISNAEHQLHPGQFVRVLLEGASREQTFAIPQRAVLDNGTGKFVYLMVRNKQGMTIAKPAAIEVGEWVRTKTNGKVENLWIINHGLHVGDQVIVNGMARIFFPGMPVQLASSQQPASAHAKH